MDDTRDGWIRVGTVDELRNKGRMVVRGGRCPILVVFHDGAIHALDNRCPHLGFPLDRGSLEDGILTCHWHHARFDVRTGGTFDPWADDAPKATTRIVGGEVFVAPDCAFAEPARHWRRRLREGMEHAIGLVVAKAVIGARAAGVPAGDLIADAALFGVGHRDGWDTGLTILTALSTLMDGLPEDDANLALYQGIRRVARDCDGQPARRDRHPLADGAADAATLKRWMARWTRVRHREGAERTLATAIAAGLSPATLADMLFAAATERTYADGGHALDFVNKAFECLDAIGWRHAAQVLPSVVGQMMAAEGAEENTAWRHPVDLIAITAKGIAAMPGAAARGRARRGRFDGHAALADRLLGDDPEALAAALLEAAAEGSSPADMARALTLAAAIRVARFGTSNEFSDWESAHHAFTYCHALHAALNRIGGDGVPEAARGLFHGAMAVYLNRFLNVPPAPLPGERGERLDDLPADAAALRAALLDTFDRRQGVTQAARLVARHLDLGLEPAPLIATLTHALLREDAGFHAFQMLEAAVREFRDWGDAKPRRVFLVAAARYLAAHSPTERAQFQTADVARRLMRGGRVHDDEGSGLV